MWVQPKNSKENSPARSKLAQQWIDYCLQPQTSNQISLFTTGTAPLLTNLPTKDILPDIQSNSLSLPDRATLNKCEFLYPLTTATKSQYNLLWKEIRQAQVNV